MRERFNQLLAEMYASPEYAASRSSNDGGSGASKTSTGTQFSAAKKKRLTRKVMKRVNEKLAKRGFTADSTPSVSDRAKQFAANNRLPEGFVRGLDVPPRLAQEEDLRPATIAAAINEMAGKEVTTDHAVAIRQRSDREDGQIGVQAGAVDGADVDPRPKQCNTMAPHEAERIVRAYQGNQPSGNLGAHTSDVYGSD